MVLRIRVTIGKKEIRIEGVNTHILARHIATELTDLLIKKNRNINFFFEGSPGPSGGGMTLILKFSDDLTDLDIKTIRKFFEIRNISVNVLNE
jgi:hypothetical protein